MYEQRHWFYYTVTVPMPSGGTVLQAHHITLHLHHRFRTQSSTSNVRCSNGMRMPRRLHHALAVNSNFFMVRWCRGVISQWFAQTHLGSARDSCHPNFLRSAGHRSARTPMRSRAMPSHSGSCTIDVQMYTFEYVYIAHAYGKSDSARRVWRTCTRAQKQVDLGLHCVMV